MDKRELQDAFRAMLLARESQPGDKLESELELAKRFGVSRNAMREVILYHCQMGLLERTKNRGTFIKTIDPYHIREELAFRMNFSGFEPAELKETRLYLETAIVPLIAKRISPSDIEALRSNISSMEENIGTPEFADELDRDFHLRLLQVCNNRTLDLFSQVIYLLFRKRYRLRFWTPEAMERSIDFHRRILDAVVREDVEKAQDLLREHILPT